MKTLRYYLNYRCVAIYTPHQANKWTSVISSAIKLSTKVIKNIKSTCQEEEHVNKHTVMMLHEKRRFLRLKNMNSCLCQTMTNWSSFNIKSLAFDHILNQHQYPSLSPQLKMFISSIIRWPQTAVAIGKKFFYVIISSMLQYDFLNW